MPEFDLRNCHPSDKTEHRRRSCPTGNSGPNILTGGVGDDILTGGAGDDTYVFGDNAGTDILTELPGNGTDTFDFTAALGALTFDLNVANLLVTGTGINLNYASTSVENLFGGSGNDQFNVNAAWTANLRGGLGNDTFNVALGVALSGQVDGGAGSDKLNWALYGAAVNVTLTVADADGFDGAASDNSNGFFNIDSFW